MPLICNSLLFVVIIPAFIMSIYSIDRVNRSHNVLTSTGPPSTAPPGDMFSTSASVNSEQSPPSLPPLPPLPPGYAPCNSIFTQCCGHEYQCLMEPNLHPCCSPNQTLCENSYTMDVRVAASANDGEGDDRYVNCAWSKEVSPYPGCTSAPNAAGCIK